MSSLPSATERKKLTAVAVVAGVLYSSWPLGYALNPTANNGLASNLEAAGQPYSWLFVAIDIVCALLTIGVAYKLASWTSAIKSARILRIGIIGLALFGLLTIIDALIPINCVPTMLHHCAPIFSDSDRYTIIHDIISIGSIFGLTLSLVSLWWLLVRRASTPIQLRWLLHVTMLLWFSFGLGTGLLLVLNLPSADSQHVFIVLSSLLTAGAPYLVYEVVVASRVEPMRRASKH
jgi:hypothetical protein